MPHSNAEKTPLTPCLSMLTNPNLLRPNGKCHDHLDKNRTTSRLWHEVHRVIAQRASPAVRIPVLTTGAQKTQFQLSHMKSSAKWQDKDTRASSSSVKQNTTKPPKKVVGQSIQQSVVHVLIRRVFVLIAVRRCLQRRTRT